MFADSRHVCKVSKHKIFWEKIMNGKEMHDHIISAVKAFGLLYWESNLITVSFLGNQLILSYENLEYRVRVK